MPNKTFLVRLRSNTIQHVRAATIEIHGKHLVFMTAERKLAALFLFEIIESWNEIVSPEPYPPVS
jgi:hypothetical protein